MSQQGKTRISVVAIVLVAALVAIFAFRSRADIPIYTATATRESIVNTISTNGKVEPVDNFEAHAATATTVRRIHVKSGDRVRAGQLVLELDDAPARAEAARALAELRAAEAALQAARSGGTQEEVLTARTQLANARSERDAARRQLDALKRLQQTGAASAGEVESAQNRLQRAESELQLLEQKRTGRYSSSELASVQARATQARAAYAAAQEALANANIRAPRTGTVYNIPVRIGAFVNPGDLLIQIADLTRLQVRAFVDEPEIGRLKPGQETTITWDALSGQSWKGTLSQVPTTVIQRGTRNVGEVFVAVQDPERRLLPNVNVNVLITTERVDQALTVPREAVHQDEDGRYVFEVTDGKLHRRKVETAISNLTRIQVTSGISDKAVVAVSAVNAQPLREGLEVRVVER